MSSVASRKYFLYFSLLRPENGVDKRCSSWRLSVETVPQQTFQISVLCCVCHLSAPEIPERTSDLRGPWGTWQSGSSRLAVYREFLGTILLTLALHSHTARLPRKTVWTVRKPSYPAHCPPSRITLSSVNPSNDKSNPRESLRPGGWHAQWERRRFFSFRLQHSFGGSQNSRICHFRCSRRLVRRLLWRRARGALHQLDRADSLRQQSSLPRRTIQGFGPNMSKKPPGHLYRRMNDFCIIQNSNMVCRLVSENLVVLVLLEQNHRVTTFFFTSASARVPLSHPFDSRRTQAMVCSHAKRETLGLNMTNLSYTTQKGSTFSVRNANATPRPSQRRGCLTLPPHRVRAILRMLKTTARASGTAVSSLSLHTLFPS